MQCLDSPRQKTLRLYASKVRFLLYCIYTLSECWAVRTGPLLPLWSQWLSVGEALVSIPKLKAAEIERREGSNTEMCILLRSALHSTLAMLFR